MARKGIHTSVDENDSEDSDKVDKHEESNTGTETPINPVPVAMKTPSVATYNVAGNVIQTVQAGLRESYECLASVPIACTARQMVFSSPWLTAKKESGSPLQTALVCNSNPLMVARVDMVINPPWNLPFLGAKGLTSPEQTATGKGISNPLMAVMVCPKPYGVNTPGSDENRLKFFDLMYIFVTGAVAAKSGSCCLEMLLSHLILLFIEIMLMFASADSIKSFLLAVQVTFLLIMHLLVMFSFLLTEIESADYVSAGHVLVPVDRDRIC
ncbi:hypothetical protein Tco_1460694 [Tanacetum coccineum]